MLRRRIKAAPAVKTRIQKNGDKTAYDIHLSTDGINYRVYKSGLKSIDEATKESVALKGSMRLWNDIIDNKK